MTTVLFLHGTGVRNDSAADGTEPGHSRSGFTAILDRINAGLDAVRPGLRAESCYWGQKGARLQADGSSFYFDPARDKTKRYDQAMPADIDEDWMLALWDRLLSDPLYEIRIRQISKPPRGG